MLKAYLKPLALSYVGGQNDIPFIPCTQTALELPFPPFSQSESLPPLIQSLHKLQVQQPMGSSPIGMRVCDWDWTKLVLTY